MIVRAARAVFALALAVFGADALAAAAAWPDALAGRVQRIKETRTVRLGYRESAIPFAYLGPDAKPVGYSLDLCGAIVATLADDLSVPLAIDYVPVTAQDRLAKVASGAVDLECGSTTSTPERRREVAFSPAIFITGTRIAVPRGKALHGVGDLRGRPVAVVRGTTTEAAIREVDRRRGLQLSLVTVDDYPAALTLLASGKVDALAADEVLLRGLLTETGRSADFRLVGELLSFEVYGIVYPKDDAGLAAVVDRTLRGLAESREIVWIYNRWFRRPLPARGAIGIPMSQELRRAFELIGLPPD